MYNNYNCVPENPENSYSRQSRKNANIELILCTSLRNDLTLLGNLQRARIHVFGIKRDTVSYIFIHTHETISIPFNKRSV